MNSFLSLKTTIRTRNFEALCGFYENILGLHKVEGWHETHDRGAIYRIGPNGSNGLLEISQIDSAHEYFQPEFREPASHKMDVQMATDDLEAWVAHLRGKWEFRGPVDRLWGSRYVYLTDPDQVQIIIYEDKS